MVNAVVNLMNTMVLNVNINARKIQFGIGHVVKHVTLSLKNAQNV